MKLILRILIMTCSIVLSILLYTHFYSLELTNESLSEGIGKRVNGDVIVNEHIEVEKYILVNFSFEKEKSYYEGYITLLKGLNNKYRLGNGYFEPSNEKLIFSDFEFTENHQLIVLGPRISSDILTVKSRVSDVKIPIKNTEHTFEVFETDSFVASIYGYTYETDQGVVNIPIDNTIVPVIDHSGELNSGPEKMVLISSFLVVLIGFVLSLLFTQERNRLEALYFKLTKQGPEVTDSDCTDYMMLH